MTPHLDPYRQPWLNRKLGRLGALDPASWRYKLVCAAGWLLWGRPLGYLSWWPRAGRSAGAMLFNPAGQVLLGRRRNMVDGNGKYSWIAGFANHGETFAQALVREAAEETRMQLNAADFGSHNMFFMREIFNDIAELKGNAQVAVSYWLHLSPSQLEQLTETNEMHDFRWVDEAQLDSMFAAGELAFKGEYTTMKEGFKRGLNRPS